MDRKEEDGGKKEAVSLKRQLKAIVSEKMWWLIILFYMGFQWSGALKNGSMSYFCKWVLDNTFSEQRMRGGPPSRF